MGATFWNWVNSWRDFLARRPLCLVAGLRFALLRCRLCPSQLARSAGRSGRLDRNRTGKSRSARSLSASWIRFTNENVRHVKGAEHVRFPGNGHAPVWRHVSYPGTSTRSSPLPPMPGCFSPAVSDCCMVQPIPLFRARWPWRQSPRLSSPTPPPWSCPSSGARGEDRCPPADASKGHQTW